MAIHDDNWTKEYAKMEMSGKERLFNVWLGVMLIAILALPLFPAYAAVAVKVIAAAGFLVTLGLSAKFIYAGVTGRW